MNLENIHVIRSSFQSLRVLCQLSNDNRTYVENSSLFLLPIKRLLYYTANVKLIARIHRLLRLRTEKKTLIRFNAYYRCLFLRLLKTISLIFNSLVEILRSGC
jgi:hypothetical protein